MVNIAFFIRHFTERGTEVSIYDYADYNESILNNKSFIICFTEKKQQSIGFPSDRCSFDKFNSRFTLIEIDDINDIKNIIDTYNINYFYTQTYGAYNDVYDFDNKDIWSGCKTIKHCVFDTTCPESDYYISISNYLNKKHQTNIPVLPLIVNIPLLSDDLRNELNIPIDAIVLGRYGGYGQFDIDFVHSTIKRITEMDLNIYFIFMNTKVFYEHPRIIYLEKNINTLYKAKFIKTCSAMIHARSDGETFGLSIGEFSSLNKPIITCNTGALEHIDILGDKAIIYSSENQLMNIFTSIQDIITSRTDWNAYEDYSPSKVMQIFNNLILKQ